jgi:hypothetical protein
MKDDERKVVGNKVTINVTNVCNVPWCKSYYGSDFKTKQVVGIVAKVKYISNFDIGPDQCYIATSFDFGFDIFRSNKILLSQLEVFVENERRKDAQNASITTHAGAVVDVNIEA